MRAARLAVLALLLLPRVARADADGAWREFSPPVRALATGAHEAGSGRYVVLGPASDVWVHDPAANSPWTQLHPAGLAPPHWYAATLLADPEGVRLFAVLNPAGDLPLEVWQLTLGDAPAWTFLANTSGGPEGRRRAGVAYDAARQQLVFFGGIGPHPTYGEVNWNDVWALSTAGTPAWSRLAPGAASPPLGVDVPTVVDPARARLVVLRGADLWAFDLAAAAGWTLLPVTDIPTQFSTRLVTDAARDRIVAYGLVQSLAHEYTSETWSLPLAGGAATRIEAAGNPGPISGGAVFADAVRARLVLYGGSVVPNYRGATAINDRTWTLELAGAPAWQSAGAPLVGLDNRWARSAWRDPARPRLLAFRGTFGPPMQHDLTADRGWADYAPAPGSPVPPATVLPVAVDRKRGAIVAFDAADLSTAWLLDTAADTWSTRLATNAPANGFVLRSAVVDSAGDRLVAVGDGLDPVFQVAVTTVWTLPLAGAAPAWTRLEPAGGPPFLTGQPTGPVAVADPRRNRVLLLAYQNEVWELALGGGGAWTRLANFPTYPNGSVVVLDAAGDRILVFFANLASVSVSQLWSWPLAQSPAAARSILPGEAPAPSFTWCGDFDPPTNRFVVLAANAGTFAYEAGAGPPPPPGLLVSCPADRVAEPGESFTLSFQVGAGDAGGIVDWTVASARPWPGFPVSSAVSLGPREVVNVDVPVQVPAGEPAGANRLVFAAGLRGTAAADECDVRVDVTESPRVDLACPPSVTWIPGGTARGRFRATVGGTAAATLEYVATSARAWPGFPLAGSAPIAGGAATFDLDVAVPDTALAGGNVVEVTVHPAGEAVSDLCAWALAGPGESPAPGEEFAVRIAPNPATEGAAVLLGLAHETRVIVEVRHLATGRLARSHDFGRLGPGTYTLDVAAAGELAPGAYAVRLLLDGFTRDTKLVVLQ